MASCERCWSNAHRRVLWEHDPAQAYKDELAAAQAEHAICTQDTIEGRKAAAGQFWDDTLQRDSRLLGDRGSP